ncbi:MAG: HDOD domain-containing protein [Planctomycetota bacterium]|nr:MAG: HDOD domain-containing protein [Planctomycetota bacterium]
MPALAELTRALRDALAQPQVSVPSPPSIISELLARIDDPETSLAEVAAVVARDPALAARVVGVANSSLYRGAAESTSVTHAVGRLGLSTLRTVALGMAAGQLARGRDLRELRSRYWTHCLATGVGAKLVGRHLGERGEETLFLAGLLFPIGRLVALHLLPAGKHPLEEVRAAVEEVHDEAGLALFERWELPSFHRDLARRCRSSEAQAEPDRWVDMISFASEAAWACGLGPQPPTEDAPPLSRTPRAERLGLTEVQVCDLEIELEDLVDELKGYLD